MAITKEYLDSIRFEIAKQKYYNAGKVDAKLDELKQEVMTLIEENEKLRRAAADVKSAKDEIGDAVINAQAQAKATVEQAEAQAAQLLSKAKADADAMTAEAKEKADKILTDAKFQASLLLEQAKGSAEKLAAPAQTGADGFSLRQLEAIDKINKQLDELNVTHATQIFRLKQAMMKMATEKLSKGMITSRVDYTIKCDGEKIWAKLPKNRSITRNSKSYVRKEAGRREADTAVSGQGKSQGCFAALAEGNLQLSA